MKSSRKNKIGSDKLFVKLKNHYGIIIYEDMCYTANEEDLFKLLHTISAELGVDIPNLFKKAYANRWLDKDIPKVEIEGGESDGWKDNHKECS